MEAFLDWFDRHKTGVIGTLTIHTLLLFIFSTHELRLAPELIEPNTTDLELVSLENIEQPVQEMQSEERAAGDQRVTNLTSNITAERIVSERVSQRVAASVEEDLRRFEQEEFDRLRDERRERGEEVTIPQLDPSKWNKELYMDKAAEPVKVEGATTVWHDLEGRVRANDVPGYLCPASGRVAVRVTVAPDGSVIKADLDPGRSANADECMLEHALRSTRRARFDRASAPQSGTVFFLFLPQ